MDPKQQNPNSSREGSSRECPQVEGSIGVEDPSSIQALTANSNSDSRWSIQDLCNTSVGRRSDSFYSTGSLLSFVKSVFRIGNKPTLIAPKPKIDDIGDVNIVKWESNVHPAITGLVTLYFTKPSKQLPSSADKINEDIELLNKYGYFYEDYYFFHGKAMSNDKQDSGKIKLYKLFFRPSHDRFRVDISEEEGLELYLYQSQEEYMNDQYLQSLRFSTVEKVNDLFHLDIKSFLAIKANIMLFYENNTLRVQNSKKLCDDKMSLDIIDKLHEKYQRNCELRNSRYEMIGERFVFGILDVQFTEDQGKVTGNRLFSLISTNIPNANSLNNNSPNTAANTNSNPFDDDFMMESNPVQPLNSGQPVPVPAPAPNAGKAHSAYLFVLLEPPSDDWNKGESALMYLEEIPDASFNMNSLENIYYVPYELRSGKIEDLLILKYDNKLMFYQLLMDRQRKDIKIMQCPVERRNEKIDDMIYSLKNGEKITFMDITHQERSTDNNFKVLNTFEGHSIIVKRPTEGKTSNGKESIGTILSTPFR